MTAQEIKWYKSYYLQHQYVSQYIHWHSFIISLPYANPISFKILSTVKITSVHKKKPQSVFSFVIPCNFIHELTDHSMVNPCSDMYNIMDIVQLMTNLQNDAAYTDHVHNDSEIILQNHVFKIMTAHSNDSLKPFQTSLIIYHIHIAWI